MRQSEMYLVTSIAYKYKEVNLKWPLGTVFSTEPCDRSNQVSHYRDLVWAKDWEEKIPGRTSPENSINKNSSPISIYIYTLWFQFAKWKGSRKPDFFVNRTCVRFPKQSFANQYWLVYEAITKWIYLVSEGVIDKKKIVNNYHSLTFE